jgi:PAS domain S-box-containing protein
VVDDDPILRMDFVKLLESAGCIAEAYESAEALLMTCRLETAGCLLLDSGLPGISGLELIELMDKRGIRVPVVMITGSGDVELAVRALKAGASDFIEKPASAKDILLAIERAIEVKAGGSAFEKMQSKATRTIAKLTPRQREIARRVVDGQPNKIIAADLAVSQRTIEAHRFEIMRKLGIKSVPDLTRMMFVASLASPPTVPETSIASASEIPGDAQPGEVESDRFGRYFDLIPLAVVVSTMIEPEHILYANPAFETLSGQGRNELEGRSWRSLRATACGSQTAIALGDAVLLSSNLVGTFQIERRDGSTAIVEAYSNVILDDGDSPAFRLVALVDIGARDSEKLEQFELQIREKDARLLEMQHRVKNNLQMITALVRVEARKAQGRVDVTPFNRLAGRINSIQLVYKLLSEAGRHDEVDLGVYLSEIASSIMHSSAVEGIRLSLKVDSFPVSVNVALPTGMVVNELLTNALKHAFVDRDGGTITLQSLIEDKGCCVIVSDDGVGLPPGVSWPKQGKLGALIVQSLRQNANADISVVSKPGAGLTVTIKF